MIEGDAILRERLRKGTYPNVVVDDAYRECVCFLCTEERGEEGVLVKRERATAFLIGIAMSPQVSCVYMVTARHVIEQSRMEGAELYAKLNLKDGTSVAYQMAPHDAWIEHDKTDVAIYPFEIKNEYSFRVVPHDTLANATYQRGQPGVQIGDEVFIVGLFSPFRTRRAEPIVRFGHVALGMRSIRLPLNEESLPSPVDAYLIETKSWGGESGSPVFHPKPSHPQSPRLPVSFMRPFLIGLMHGHYEVPVGIEGGDGSVDVNAGIAVVIPSQ